MLMKCNYWLYFSCNVFLYLRLCFSLLCICMDTFICDIVREHNLTLIVHLDILAPVPYFTYVILWSPMPPPSLPDVFNNFPVIVPQCLAFVLMILLLYPHLMIFPHNLVKGHTIGHPLTVLSLWSSQKLCDRKPRCATLSSRLSFLPGLSHASLFCVRRCLRKRSLWWQFIPLWQTDVQET